MVTINPQYIKDTAGKKLVVLPEEQYNNLIDELEELQDVKQYDKAKKGKLTFNDAETVFNKIESQRKKDV